MSVAALAAVLACVLFCAAMLHAAFTDLRQRRIANWLSMALALSWAPMGLAAGWSGSQLAAALMGAALVFFAGFGCFAAGWLGGGDVKLATVAVLWLGAGQTIAFLLLAALLGATLAWPLLLFGRRSAWFVSGQAEGEAGSVEARQVPYGPALAFTGIALLRGSPWAEVL